MMRRVLVELGVIVGGFALWWLSAMLGLEIVKRVGMMDPDAGYMVIVIFAGGPVVLMALACSTFFLWVKRDVRLFFASTVLIGLATSLWPLVWMWLR